MRTRHCPTLARRSSLGSARLAAWALLPAKRASAWSDSTACVLRLTSICRCAPVRRRLPSRFRCGRPMAGLPQPARRRTKVPDRHGAPARAWQRMLSGRRLDLLDPSPLDVEIEDIAHGLARVARWNGQTFGDHAFSVAQHSLLVERILRLQSAECSPREKLATLLHDAPEYVIGDLISPFKAVIDTPYKEVEARL